MNFVKNCRYLRNEHTRRYFSTILQENSHYNDVISQAEKIVGISTSFLSLKFLLNDDIADVAKHIKKIIGTQHPLIQTTQELLIKRDNVPTYGLIVLLVSKCHKSNVPDYNDDILLSQRTLSEVTEMIKTSNLLHNSLYNNSETENELSLDTINDGNKLSLLSGDYLLSTSFKLLAEMRNQKVNELISTALRDINESNFIGTRDLQNRPIPAKPKSDSCDTQIPVEFECQPYKAVDALGFAKNEWVLRNLLGGATLLAKACESSAILSKQSRKLQKNCHLFGRNFGLLFQAHQDLQNFEIIDDSPFNLTCAPVLFHIKHNPEFFYEIEKFSENLEKINYKQIKEIVRHGPGIKDCISLKNEFSDLALTNLHAFEKSAAKNVLKNIIEVL